MISVIIPLYNAEKTIVDALNSIKAQTIGVQEFEVIIINDGSTDQSVNVAENYIQEHPEMNIQLLNQPNGGVSNARNAGLRIAKGEYIALLDSDDEWLPEKTERQLFYLENKEISIDFLATRRNKSKILYPYRVINHLAEITFRKLFIRNEAQPSTVIFKRKVLENTGYFDGNQKYAEDVNYWMKISLNNTMYILDEDLLLAGKGKRSFGVSGLSANLSEMEKGYQKNVKEMYSLKRINFLQCLFYRFLYKAKYLLLLLRTSYYSILSTETDSR